MADKLLSRKFWAMAVSTVALFSVGAYSEVATIIVGYLAVQAAVDFGTAWQTGTTAATPEVPPAAHGSDYEEASAWTGSVT